MSDNNTKNTTNSLIRLTDVSRSYWMGDSMVHALRDVCLDVQRGEQLAIVGPSGSGKSTLMNLIGLLERPSTGIVSIDGRTYSDLTQSEDAGFRGRTIGFVFQQFHLVPYLSAAQNVELPLRYQRIGAVERTSRVFDVLDVVGLAKRMHHLPQQLSGGERQRVAIARALVCGPRLILADEPTGALDSENGEAVLNLMLSLSAEQQITLLLVTHDQALAARLPRCVRLMDGRIVADAHCHTN
jgi:putative ABC transport system ATP-binding protein